jgi:hypothetical protein
MKARWILSTLIGVLGGAVMAAPGMATGPDTRPADGAGARIRGYYNRRIVELGVDPSSAAKLDQKIAALARALQAWDAKHARQIADLAKARAAAIGANDDAKVKQVDGQLQSLRGQRGELLDDLHGEALTGLKPDDRAAWYAADLHSLATAYADQLGGGLSPQGNWKALDVARAKGQELAQTQSGVATRKATSAARNAVLDSIHGMIKRVDVEGTPAAVTDDSGAARGQATDQTRPGGNAQGAPPSTGDAGAAGRIRDLKERRDQLQWELDSDQRICASRKQDNDELNKEIAQLRDQAAALQKKLDDCKKGKPKAE